MSFTIPKEVPTGVPQSIFTPLPWEPASMYHWKVIKDMGEVPPMYFFAAIVPAVMVAALYFFDHSIASQIAQQKEFNGSSIAGEDSLLMFCSWYFW
ncbi:hypothetical protein C5167_026027 [Papaver somniferum]|nr:hypothetical protein C5167_026027 [Papaver somniferum]